MRKIFFVARFWVAVCCFFGPASMFAQVDERQPDTRHTAILSEGGPDSLLRFTMNWPVLRPGFTSLRFVDPPRSIEVLPPPDSVPEWKYFWVFDDGYFSTNRPTVSRIYRPGNTPHVVYTGLKAIYTDAEEPNMVVDTFFAGEVVSPPLFSSAVESSILFTQQYHTSRPNDWVMFVLAFRNQSDDARAATVRLSYDRALSFSQFEIMGSSSDFGTPEISSPSPHLTPRQQTEYTWEIPSVGRNEERMIAFRMKVENLDPVWVDRNAHNIALYAGVEWRSLLTGPIDGGGSDDDVTANPDSDNVGIAQKQLQAIQVVKGGGLNLENAGYREWDDTLTLSVRSAIDPNKITVIPSAILPGNYTGNFDYALQFENTGQETARSVKVTFFPDRTLNAEVSEVGYNNTRFDPVEFNCSIDSCYWATEQDIPANVLDTGLVFYSLPVKAGAPPYRDGDKIKTRARIQMDGHTVWTDFAVTDVIQPKYCLPGYWGARAYIEYGIGGDTLLHKGGFRAALTWRKNIGGLRNEDFNEPFIKITRPTWWWQVELGGGYSKMKATDAINLNIYRADLTPVMIRWVSKPIGNSSKPFFLGGSLGYTLSGILGASASGGDYQLSNSFGDRLEHSIMGMIDAGNILGKPGLSYGIGYAQRFTKILGQSDTYGLGFLYIHYNFKKKLF